jgi:hypothetical protein
VFTIGDCDAGTSPTSGKRRWARILLLEEVADHVHLGSKPSLGVRPPVTGMIGGIGLVLELHAGFSHLPYRHNDEHHCLCKRKKLHPAVQVFG